MNTYDGNQGKPQRPGSHPPHQLRPSTGTLRLPRSTRDLLRWWAVLALVGTAGSAISSQAEAAQSAMSSAAGSQLMAAFSAPALAVAVQRLPGRTPSEELVILKPPEKPVAPPDAAPAADAAKVGQQATAAKPGESGASATKSPTIAPGLDKPDAPVAVGASKPAIAPVKPVASKPGAVQGATPAAASSTAPQKKLTVVSEKKQAIAPAKGNAAAKPGDKPNGEPNRKQATSRTPTNTTAKQAAARKPAIAAAKPATAKKSPAPADKQATARKAASKGRDPGKDVAKQVGSSGTAGTQSSAARATPPETDSKPAHQLPPIIERSVESSR